jgi:hypothetical protein
MSEEIAALKVGDITSAPPATYRLIWHPWHQNTAAITAYCGPEPFLEIVQTDGHGTYSIGKRRSRKTTPLTAEECHEISRDFGRVQTLKPQVDVFPKDESGDEKRLARICIHSSSYSLEFREGDVSHQIYRHCHLDENRDFEISRVLIFFAWRELPNAMKDIDPLYLASDGKSRTLHAGTP